MDEHSIGMRESTSNLRACDNYSTTDGLQLFNTIPALNEASSILAQTTSYFTSCFSGDVELDEGQELITLTSSHHQGPLDVNQATTPGDVELDEGQELITFTSSQHQGPLDVNQATTSKQCGDENTSSINGNLAASSVGSSTLGSNGQLVSNRMFRNGSSMFKDLVDRARKTVRGSADDIGWLLKATDMPPVEDGTERFLEILEGIRNNEHKLPNSVVYLLIPGLFSNHGPLYFVNTKTYFSKMGLACHIAKIHSEASVEKNAREIKQYIEEISWGSRKRVLLLGHSKGGVDAAAALSLYWSDLKDKVAGLVLAQSPYGGSPIASDILREGQLGDYVSLRKMMEILVCKVIKGDMLALEDLTYERRKDFLRKHQLPQELPIVSFHTEAGITPSVLATLSHVAHAELPIIPTLADGQPTKLPVVMPLGAVMAACAQLLQVRYGEKSDGLVTRRDAEVPGSVVVRPEKKLDHAWMVYSTSNNIDPVETDASKVCEALLTLLVEVAHKRRHEIANKDE